MYPEANNPNPNSPVGIKSDSAAIVPASATEGRALDQSIRPSRTAGPLPAYTGWECGAATRVGIEEYAGEGAIASVAATRIWGARHCLQKGTPSLTWAPQLGHVCSTVDLRYRKQ